MYIAQWLIFEREQKAIPRTLYFSHSVYADISTEMVDRPYHYFGFVHIIWN